MRVFKFKGKKVFLTEEETASLMKRFDPERAHFDKKEKTYFISESCILCKTHLEK